MDGQSNLSKTLLSNSCKTSTHISVTLRESMTAYRGHCRVSRSRRWSRRRRGSGFLEKMIELEVTTTLGRNRYQRGSGSGYRNGTRTRRSPQVCSMVRKPISAPRCWAGGDGAQPLRGGAEQDVINRGLVLEGMAAIGSSRVNTTWEKLDG
jgi:hypothetical protein